MFFNPVIAQWAITGLTAFAVFDILILLTVPKRGHHTTGLCAAVARAALIRGGFVAVAPYMVRPWDKIRGLILFFDKRST